MQIHIKNLAELFSGVYVNAASFKGKVVYYLQMRDWDKERNWADWVEPELREEERFYKNYLKDGDLLLATKGGNHFAVLYDGRYSPAVASSVFTVLRIRDAKIVLPAYLQWYLNHPATSKRLAGASKGTSMPLITMDVIEQLEVPLPSLEKQWNILHIQHLQRQSTLLRRSIHEMEEAIFYHNLLQIANK